MFKRFQNLKQAYKTITRTKPKITETGKKKIELLKKLGSDQKKIGIDKYKEMGGNKLANEVLNVDKKAKGGRIGFAEGSPKSKTNKKDYKPSFKFQGDYKGKNLPERALEFIKTAGKQHKGAFKKIKEKMAKEPEIFKKKGGRIGFRKGTGKSGVPAMDIKSTPTKKLSEKQKKIARLAGDPRKIDKPDFAKLRNRNKKVI